MTALWEQTSTIGPMMTIHNSRLQSRRTVASRNGRTVPGCLCGIFFVLLLAGPAHAAYEPPAWVPSYDLDMRIYVDQHVVFVRERMTWTNYHKCPTRSVVFNNHSHFTIKKDI